MTKTTMLFISKLSHRFMYLLSSPITFITFMGLYPVIFLISKNWFVYDTKQLLFLLIVPAITCSLGLILIGISLFFKNIILLRLNVKLKSFIESYLINSDVAKIAFGLVGFIILSLLLENSFGNSRIIYMGFVAGALVACFLIKFTGFYFVNLTLLISTFLAGMSLSYSVYTKPIGGNMLLPTLNKARDDSIVFHTKPNIYLIHLESYHSPAAMKRLYNFDNKDFEDSISELGFYVSQNNFSNYPATLTSVASIFLEQHDYYKLGTGLYDALGVRDMIGGRIYNPTVSILKNNGYKVFYLHPNTYAFQASKLIDYYYPTNNIHDSLLIFESDVISGLRTKLFGLTTPERRVAYVDDYSIFDKVLWDALENRRIEGQPYFYFIEYYGARHSPASNKYSWETDLDEQVSRYTNIVKEVNPKIVDVVKRIVGIDPAAVIILYGDHGSWKYRGMWADSKGRDLNEIIYERGGITGEDLAYDLFGSFMAVRFPDGNAKILDGETHVNIFRKLFYELSDNEDILKDKPENESYIKSEKKVYVLVKDGVPLKKIELKNVK